jgi:hypothetical protein
MARRAHTGRPGTLVIPTGWQASHANAIRSTRTADVVVLRPQGATFGAGLTVTPHSLTISAGQARIQARDLQGRPGGSAASEDVNAADYLIQLDWDTDLVQVGDEVFVISSSDWLMDGRTFRVRKVILGTERFTRDLICELDTQNGATPA